MREIGNQILDHIHRGQRGDADLTLQILDRGGAGEAVRAVDVHRARSANALAARAAESERRILNGLDLDQRVEDHRPAIVEINLENAVAGIVARIWIVAVDLKTDRRSAGYGTRGSEQ